MLETSARLLGALTYPRSLHDFLELVAPLHAAHEIRARVVDVRRETHDVATLVLAPRRWRGHRPGQWVALTAEIGGVRRTRCFSIASAPSRRGPLGITIKAQPGGAVTPSLVSGGMKGKIVVLSEAQGDFVLPRVIPARLLLLSGGSGITPVMSMLRALVGAGHTGTVAFVHHARSAADVVFREELAALARKKLPGLSIELRVGPFTDASLPDDVASFETFACGPAPFLAAVRASLRARGAEARMHEERFTLGPTSDGGEDGEVSFVRSAKRAKGKGPLLVMAEQSGLTPKSGCRMGICRTCTCRKIAGATRDLRTGEISTDADVDIQLCVSAPVGPVSLDL